MGKGGDQKRAFQVFDGILQRGLMPDVFTFNALIRACDKGADQKRAFQVFDELLQRGLMPDVFTFNAMISAYEKGELPGRALDLIAKLGRNVVLQKPEVASQSVYAHGGKIRLGSSHLGTWTFGHVGIWVLEHVGI